MKCYLIRHGRTEGNDDLKFNGCRTDDPLTREGKEALKRIEEIEEGAMLFVSPMTRARETASIMLPGLEQNVVEDIREMDFGYFEGKNHEDLDGDPEYQKWLDSGGSMAVPGGEDLQTFGRRVMRGLARAVRTAVGAGTDVIYLVAHGGTIMALMSILTGKNYYEFNLPNGAGYVTELEVDDAGNVLAAGSYDRFFGGLRDGSSDWRPPQYTPSDQVDR